MGGAVRRQLATSAYPVTITVRLVAHERPPPHNLLVLAAILLEITHFRDIIQLVDGWAGRVDKASMLVVLGQKVDRRPPIGDPLPSIADHVVKPPSVLLPVLIDWSSLGITIPGCVHLRKLTLPDVHAIWLNAAAQRLHLVAPWEKLSMKPPARGVLPLCLARQSGVPPTAIPVGVIPRHVHYRVVPTVAETAREALQIAVDPLRLPPCGVFHRKPPRGIVNLFVNGGKHRLREVRFGHKGIPESLDLGHKTRLGDEL
mmetsp:Transcript_73316/g.203391  ORF Transcript_73316/g.203391 Transcript_73316/m.203391 type:complete len:258 (-) Transcript_73316:480-1253(-)